MTIFLWVSRLAQVFDPSKARGFSVERLNEHLAGLEQLKCFGKFEKDLSSGGRSRLLTKMGEEIPGFYTALQAVDVNTFNRDDVQGFTTAVLDWWRTEGKCVPHWQTAARIMFAIPPSSAAAERVFSILANSFGPQRSRALNDLLEGTILVSYNSAKRQKERKGEVEVEDEELP